MKTEQLHIKITPEERQMLVAQAEAQGLTQSQYVRWLVHQINNGATLQEPKKTKKK